MLKYDDKTHTITTDTGYLKLAICPVPLLSPYQIGLNENPEDYIEITKASYDHLYEAMNPKTEEPQVREETEKTDEERKD